MSDHEFEKRVRQELNDLKITPSSSTWVKIEEELKQSRRRRPLLWLPFLFLGLAVGGYVLLNQPAKTPTTASVVKAKPTASKNFSNQGSVKTETRIPPTTISANQNNTTKTATTLPSKDIAKISTPASPDRLHRTTSPQKQGPSIQIPGAKLQTAKSSEIAARNDKDPLINAVVDDMLSTDRQENDDVAANDKASITATTAAPESPLAGHLLNYRFTVGSENDFPAPAIDARLNKIRPVQPFLANAATPQPILIKKPSKWSYAVTASAGWTMIGEGNLGVNKSMVEDVSRSSSDNQAPTIASPGPYRPSSINPGLGYTVGGIVKRELSKRFALSAGLNYTRLTTSSTVGEQVNQTRQLNNGPYGSLTVSSYFLFQEDQPKEYTNRYHFIELPVTLHTTLINSKTLPLYWNAGVSVSRLLTSNSLLFDGTSGVYYRDQKLINQTQAAVSTGFSFSLLNRSRHPLWVGPELRYNLSRILDKGVNGNKHLMYLGLGIKWFLKK